MYTIVSAKEVGDIDRIYNLNLGIARERKQSLTSRFSNVNIPFSRGMLGYLSENNLLHVVVAHSGVLLGFAAGLRLSFFVEDKHSLLPWRQPHISCAKVKEWFALTQKLSLKLKEFKDKRFLFAHIVLKNAVPNEENVFSSLMSELLYFTNKNHYSSIIHFESGNRTLGSLLLKIEFELMYSLSEPKVNIFHKNFP